MTRKQKLTFYILALIVSTPAWIYLIYSDWKLGIALLLIMWGNNLTNTASNN
jgi:hypothetical protein